MDTPARQPARPRINLRDPRYYQIAVLSSLVTFGVAGLNFGIRIEHALAIVSTALFVQWLGTRLASLPAFDPLSPLITALSLTLLLRTDSLPLAALAAAIAIGSKFVIRIRGKHVFNPANIAIVTLMLASDRAWISTGQWGSAALGAFVLACLGFLVLTRARRAETTIAFLTGFAALLVGRALWLGDPLAIPLHQMQNGALLIFAFFMISDPKTTPDTCFGRVLYGLLVALVTYWIQFVLYEPGAPVLALIVCAPVVPVIDAVYRGRLYQWTAPARDRLLTIPETSKGGS
ncbi:MAG: RnfABCDGE type electron transport complex subunit D [Woeseiaceae bacterium]|nr:RnfABCDGE type electron transport complex subunit D [Woeseiaceae bacterium]